MGHPETFLHRQHVRNGVYMKYRQERKSLEDSVPTLSYWYATGPGLWLAGVAPDIGRRMITLGYAAGLVIIALGLIWPDTLSAEKPSREYPTVEIPGWHAEAIAVALREFKKNQGGKTDDGEPVYGDLAHYTIAISQSPPDLLPIEYELDECVRVDFHPEYGAIDRERKTLGGRTSFGIQVAYDVHRGTMKIVKTSFSR